MNIPNKLFIYKDDRYGIVLARDAFKAAVIQLVLFVDQSRQMPDGTIQSAGKAIHTIWNEAIPAIGDISKQGGQITIVSPDQFKQQIRAKITAAQTVLAKLKEADQNIDGAIADYVVPCKQFNEEKK